MPRRKRQTVQKAKRGKPTKAQSVRSAHTQKKGINWTESYSSFLLGIVVVIVAVLFGVSLIRQQTHQETSSIATGPTPTAAVSPTPGTTVVEGEKTYYIVKADDSLWNIAVAVYKDGYKWTEIATANKLVSPGTIFTGDKLLLPNAPKPSEFGQMMQKTEADKITANTYTVKKDDTLWDIAVRAYGDGYKWTEIAKANKLANPDLIFSGNVLQLPR